MFFDCSTAIAFIYVKYQTSVIAVLRAGSPNKDWRSLGPPHMRIVAVHANSSLSHFAKIVWMIIATTIWIANAVAGCGIESDDGGSGLAHNKRKGSRLGERRIRTRNDRVAFRKKIHVQKHVGP